MDSNYYTYRDGKYINVPPIDDLCLALKDKFLKQEEQIKQLKNKIDYLSKENFKDEELKSLKEKIQILEREKCQGFFISDKEQEAIRKWHDNHDCKYKGTRLQGTSEYKFSIIPGIGYNGYVKCSCGKEFCFYEE